MTLYNESKNFTPWQGEPINGIRYPRDIEEKWTATDLEAIDLWRSDMIATADPIPDGKVVIGESVQRVDGVVKWVHELADTPEPDPAQIIEAFRVAIQEHVDAQARSRRYDSGNSLATYVTSTVIEWASEANAFVAWRDAVWAYAYAEMDKVLGGLREQPTVQEFLDELPTIVWPGGDE